MAPPSEHDEIQRRGGHNSGEASTSAPPCDGGHEEPCAIVGSPGAYGGSLAFLNRQLVTQPSTLESFSDPPVPEVDEEAADDSVHAPLLLHQHSFSGRSVAGTTPMISGNRISDHESEPARQPVQDPPSRPSKRGLMDGRAILFGCINSVITIPVMIAFCKVIFQEPEFEPYQAMLVRLVFLSSATHQLVFTLRSCVPGAVGQVQDVGLIFLSAMATAVVARGRDSGADFGDTLATSLLLMTLVTFTVGVLVILVARLKVASIVQYVPVPVVGGYLAFVGYFICVSGIQLATGLNLGSVKGFLQLLTAESALRLLPALAAWQVFHHTVSNFASPFALPMALVSVVAFFYVVLFVSGLGFEDAQKSGWLPAPDEDKSPFYKVWQLYRVRGWPGNIDWGAFPRQLPNLVALFMVVSFGSCMDIAAIQAQYPKELDFNNELELIGFSNAIVGIGGVGLTGSYIFSQTLFNLKFGAGGPLTGVMIVLAELAMFALPTSPVQFFPGFFFGGLMLWLGIDIMYDWLAASWNRLRKFEYALIWVTFVAVTVYGLEGGILIGIVSAMAIFAYEYSKLSVTCFNVAASRSSYMRTYHQRFVLDRLSSNMVAISLSGYIFFGSATVISHNALRIADILLKSSTEEESSVDQGSRHESPDMEAKIRQVKAHAPKTLLLDFRKVSGFDATAAQSFNVLHRQLMKKGVEMVIAHIPRNRQYIHDLLVANGVAAKQICTAGITPQPAPGCCMVFDLLNTGLHFLEEQLLEVAVGFGACKAMVDDLPLSQLLEANRSVFSLQRSLLPYDMLSNLELVASEMTPFLELCELNNIGTAIFSRGEHPEAIYIVQSGIISCEVDMTFARSVGHESSMLLRTLGNDSHADRGRQEANENYANVPGLRGMVERVFGRKMNKVEFPGYVHLVEYGPGGILGDLDFFLQRTRSFSAKVKVAPCKVLRLSHDNMLRMAAEAPKCLLVLQMIILRSSSLSSSHAMEALEMSSI